MTKKRIYAYFDASNFYHLSNINYGIAKVKYNHLSNRMIKTKTDELIQDCSDTRIITKEIIESSAV